MSLIGLDCYFSCNHAENDWWAQQDSNLRHADYESAALPTELWARQWVKHTRYFTLLKIF
jgi:hypothetical protein